MREVLLNQPVSIPFTSSGLVTGKTVFAPTLLIDGAVQVPSFTYVEIGAGLYKATFTPTVTGIYTLFIEDSIQETFKVVSISTQELLRNIEDQALGSWVWDKTTGELTLMRQDSSILATFQVTDTLEAASRERVT